MFSRMAIFATVILTASIAAAADWVACTGTGSQTCTTAQVGIGVNPPTSGAQVDISGGVRLPGVTYPTTDGAAWIVNEANVGLALQSGGSMRLRTAGTSDRIVIDSGGRIGVGVTPPSFALWSNTATNILDPFGTGVNASALLWRANAQGYTAAVRNDTTATYSNGLLVSVGATDANSTVLSVASGTVSRLLVRGTGQTIIGDPNAVPAGTQSTDVLVVSGAIRAASVIGAVYQDVAEWVPAAEALSPGDVVVLNPAKNNEVMRSSSAYDTSVAGVVSAHPGVVLGVAGEDKAQIATTGRVRVHCDASKGAIRVGSLLVTSDRPGVAMASQPVDVAGMKMHRPGTILGKALEPLPKGEGDILVLLSLQ